VVNTKCSLNPQTIRQPPTFHFHSGQLKFITFPDLFFSVKFSDAWEDADNILTLIALIPAFILLSRMSQNMFNPEFDVFAGFESGMQLMINAILPNFGATFALALVILLLAYASNSSTRR